ncbi:unnamed protein product, partial [Ixodes pacificus]
LKTWWRTSGRRRGAETATRRSDRLCGRRLAWVTYRRGRRVPGLQERLLLTACGTSIP